MSGTTHLLVHKSVHRRLKILSAELGIPMQHLTEEGIQFVIDKYQDKNKKKGADANES